MKPHFSKLKRRNHKMFTLEEDLDLKETNQFRTSNKSSFSDILYEHLQNKNKTDTLYDSFISPMQESPDLTCNNVIHSIGKGVSSIPTYKNHFSKTRFSMNCFRGNSAGKDYYKEAFGDYDRSLYLKDLQIRSSSHRKSRVKTGKLSALWPSKQAKVRDISISGGPCAFSKSPIRSPMLSRNYRKSKQAADNRAASIEPGLGHIGETSNFFSTIDLNESRFTPTNFEVITKIIHRNRHSAHLKPEVAKPKTSEGVKILPSNLNSYRDSNEKLRKESSGTFFCSDNSMNIRGRSISPTFTSDIGHSIPTPYLDNIDLHTNSINPPATTIEACNQVSLQATSRNAYYSTQSIDMKGDDAIYSLDKVMITIKPKTHNGRYSHIKQGERISSNTYKPCKVSLDDSRLLQNIKEERPKSGKMYGKVVKGRSFVFRSDGNKYPVLKIESRSIM